MVRGVFAQQICMFQICVCQILEHCVYFRGVVRAFVVLAHGIEHQVGGGTQHGVLRRSGTVNKLVNSSPAVDAAFDDMDDSLVSEKVAAFGVSDGAGVEKEHGVGGTSIDVERAGLVGVAEHR